ncbi:MAG: CRTAC1 family protein [Acidobacteriota bacterium]
MSQEPFDPDYVEPTGDDEIIGRFFWISLRIFALIAVIGAVAWWFTRDREEVVEEQTIEAAAPEMVEEVAVGDAGPPAPAFADITEAAGITFSHESGARGDKLLPESMGSGVAFFDYDRDGDPDLFFVNSTTWPGDARSGAAPTQALYRNDGGGSFTDVTAAAGLDLELYGMGVAVGDIDSDGWPDLFLSAVGENRLLRNAEGRFEDVTAGSGVSGSDESWSTAAAFFDLEGDGDLDLFVGNYVQWSREIDFEVDYRLTGVGRAYGPPVNYQGAHSYLYRNEGDGTFTDVSEESGIRVDNPATGEPAGKALGVAPVDVDGDDFIDLLVANDTVGNFFFRNLGDGTFLEEGALLGVAYGRNGEATGAMGIDSAHLRNDSDLGFMIGNFANEMTSVYVSQGDPSIFADEAIAEGIGAPTRTALTFGVFLFDYDLDGRLDLLQANGHLEEEIATVDPSQSYRQSAQLFWNAGLDARQGFAQVADDQVGDLTQPIVGRGAAYADIDGDGDLDVALTQTGGAPLLLRNDQQTGHSFLRIKLEGDPASGVNGEAIGTWVEIEAGGITQRRQVMPTKSYLSQSELPLTFGFGATDAVDAARVRWPDGSVQELDTAQLSLGGEAATVTYSPGG